MSSVVESGGEPIAVSLEHRLEPLLGGAPAKSVARSAEQTTDPGGSESTELGSPRTIGSEVTLHRHGLLQASQSLVYIVIVALFIITFTVQPFRIPSASMEPTLLVGDFLLVNKQVGREESPHVFAPTNVIHRGDLIVFHYPVDSSMHLVKRVVGLPGDHLRLRSGRVYINGSAISEPYAVYRPTNPDSYRDEFPRMVSAAPDVNSRWWIEMHSLVSQGELTVPAGNYFVLGDNRNDSEDSRYWGFVPRAAIVGKPILVYFSLNDSAVTPGRASASATAGSGDPRHHGRADSFFNFARWHRALHIVH